MKRIYFLSILLITTQAATQALGAVGFGSRKTTTQEVRVKAPVQDQLQDESATLPEGTALKSVDQNADATPAAENPKLPASPEQSSALSTKKPSSGMLAARISDLKLPEPPQSEDIEWIQVPFEKAEQEVLSLFHKDLVEVEEFGKNVAVYEVRAQGRLPSDYQKSFRNKLEQVLVQSPKFKVKECRTCEEARLIKSEDGQLRYENYSNDRTRPAKMAAEAGADHLFLAEVNYSPEDYQLRVRMIDGTTGELKWSKAYSTADVVKYQERSGTNFDPNRVGEGDSLGRVIIGEIAFAMIISPGISLLPTINTGSGSALIPTPGVDLFIGERFDRNHRMFGFNFGAGYTLMNTSSTGQPLPWFAKFAPQFRYNFNPYNMSSARYSVHAEIGAMLSTGMTTPYIGLGPEVAMINRFSFSLMPMYIFKSGVRGKETLLADEDGNLTSQGSEETGKFGGLGAVVKVNINW